MTKVTESATRAVREFTEPVIAAVDESMRDLRRAVGAGRYAVENCAADATRIVRRHPLVSFGSAVCVGALFGCVFGFAVGRFGGRGSE